MAKNFTFHETAWKYSLLYIFWETTPPLVTGMLATGLKNILNRKFFVSSFFFLLYQIHGTLSPSEWNLTSGHATPGSDTIKLRILFQVCYQILSTLCMYLECGKVLSYMYLKRSYLAICNKVKYSFCTKPVQATFINVHLGILLNTREYLVLVNIYKGKNLKIQLTSPQRKHIFRNNYNL